MVAKLFLPTAASDWWSNGAKTDRERVSPLSTKSAISPRAIPRYWIHDIRVGRHCHSDGGKRTEKVLFFKHGDKSWRNERNDLLFMSLMAPSSPMQKLLLI